MNMRPVAVWGLVTLALVATPAQAYDPITWHTHVGGGVVGAVSGAYRLSGTIGQPDAGTHSGGVYTLRGGFWRRAIMPPVGQQTYTWNVASGAWTTPSSWTPARTTPAASDILIFDGAVTPTASATGMPQFQSIAQLRVKGSIAAMFHASSKCSLRVTGDAGEDLDIAAGSTLGFAASGGGNSESLLLGSGATGRVSGQLTVQTGAHRVLPTDKGSLVFTNGANCWALDGLIGSLFGSAGPESVVVFQAGSAYQQDAGDVAFGLPAPQSRIVLEHGSLYRHLSPGPGGAFDGRTYGDCELSMTPGSAYLGQMVMGCTMDDLSITSGRLTVLAGASNSILDVRGRLVVLGDGILEMGGPGPAMSLLRFTGSAMQSGYFGGTIALGPLSLFEVVNPAGFMLETYLFTSGAVTLSGGLLYTGEHMLHLGPASSVTGPRWVVGNLGRIVSTSGSYLTKTFEVGDFAHAAPVAIEFESVGDSGTVVVHTDGGDHADLAASGLDPAKSVNRVWTVTNLGTTFPSCSAVFAFDPAEIDPGADPDQFGVGLREGGVWSLPRVGTRTATTTQALSLTSFEQFVVAEPAASVGVGHQEIPAVTSLSAARPSPFRSRTEVEFGLARGGHIELSIYDVTGRRVRTLERGVFEAGMYRSPWDGRDGEGMAVPTGTYFCRLVTPQGDFRRTLIRLR